MNWSYAIVLVVVTFAATLHAADPKPDPAVEQRVRELIETFNAREYGVYLEARIELVAIGRPAVPLLQKAAKSDDKRIADRAVNTIERIERAEYFQKRAEEKAKEAAEKARAMEEGAAAAAARGAGAPEIVQTPLPDDMWVDLMDGLGLKLGEFREGPCVTDLRADSPAEKAGILVGDVISGIDGLQVATLEQVRDALTDLARGKALKLEITRKEDTVVISIVQP
jgi:predicted metalloprotease with PDZ domain